MRHLISLLTLFAVAMPAFAADVGVLPEPGSLALFGVAAAAAIAVGLRKKK